MSSRANRDLHVNDLDIASIKKLHRRETVGRVFEDQSRFSSINRNHNAGEACIRRACVGRFNGRFFKGHFCYAALFLEIG